MDRKGRETPINAPARVYDGPALSPDGGLLAVEVRDQQSDIWIWDFRSAALKRLTFNQSISATWTSDGRSILFSSLGDEGTFNIYKQPADGGGPAARLTISGRNQFVRSVAPDGSRLIGAEIRQGSGDIVSWPAAGGTETAAESLVGTNAGEYDPSISPDGRYLAYESNETGRSEIYVRPFPNTSAGRWLISTNGGATARWAPSGRELFYLDPSGALMAVRVETAGRAFSNGAPARLFDAPAGSGTGFSVHPDGRFLMVKDAPHNSGAAAPEIIVVVGWFEELKSRLPAGQ